MRIRVLFFGQYREWAGADQFDLELVAGATARELVDRVRQDGRLARIPAEPAVAVNEAFAPLTHGLHDGDEVALLPPIAGG